MYKQFNVHKIPLDVLKEVDVCCTQKFRWHPQN